MDPLGYREVIRRHNHVTPVVTSASSFVSAELELQNEILNQNSTVDPFPLPSMGSSISRNAPKVVRKLPTSPGVLSRATQPAKPESQTASPQTRPETSPRNADGDEAEYEGFADRLRVMGHVERRSALSTGPQDQSSVGQRLHSMFESRSRLEEFAIRNEGLKKENIKPEETLMDIESIVRAVALREQGVADDKIEERLRLRRGTLQRLGPPGLLKLI